MGNYGGSTGELLERLGLTAFFEEIVTFEYGFTPKPSGEGVNYLVEKYALEIDEYNKLGASVSQGCVRLSASRTIATSCSAL